MRSTNCYILSIVLLFVLYCHWSWSLYKNKKYHTSLQSVGRFMNKSPFKRNYLPHLVVWIRLLPEFKFTSIGGSRFVANTWRHIEVGYLLTKRTLMKCFRWIAVFRQSWLAKTAAVKSMTLFTRTKQTWKHFRSSASKECDVILEHKIAQLKMLTGCVFRRPT